MTGGAVEADKCYRPCRWISRPFGWYSKVCFSLLPFYFYFVLFCFLFFVFFVLFWVYNSLKIFLFLSVTLMRWIMGSRNLKSQRIQDTLTPVWMKYFLLKSPGLECFLEKKMLRWIHFLVYVIYFWEMPSPQYFHNKS